MLCHMAVHPEYRRGKIATRMIAEMLKQLDPKRDVTVMTFREGDEKGIAPRALYQKLGLCRGNCVMIWITGSKCLLCGQSPAGI